MKQVDLLTYRVQGGETITLEVNAIGNSETSLIVSKPFNTVSGYPTRYIFEVDTRINIITAAISASFPPDSAESAVYKLALIGSSGGDTAHFSISKTSAVKDITICFIVDHPGIQPPEPWPHA